LLTITDAELQAASKDAQDITDALYEDKHVAAMGMLEAVEKYHLDGKEVARLMQGMAAIGWIMGCHNVDFDTAAASHPLLTKLSGEWSRYFNAQGSWFRGPKLHGRMVFYMRSIEKAARAVKAPKA
jgi:hypothetical protein